MRKEGLGHSRKSRQGWSQDLPEVQQGRRDARQWLEREVNAGDFRGLGKWEPVCRKVREAAKRRR